MKLPKYNPELNCPKCAHGDVSTSYCVEERPGKVCWCSGVRKNDHLHRRCRRCSYEWLEDAWRGELVAINHVGQKCKLGPHQDDSYTKGIVLEVKTNKVKIKDTTTKEEFWIYGNLRIPSVTQIKELKGNKEKEKEEK